MSGEKTKSEFLHALFVLKSLLGSEFGKPAGAADLSVGMAQYVLLKEVSKARGGSVDLTRIREYLAISKGAVSQMLSSLEKRALITREVNPADRRNLIVKLTASGEAALRKKEEEAGARMQKVTACLGEADTRLFVELISRINDAIIASK